MHTHSTGRRALLLLPAAALSALALAAGGCGGDDDEDEGAAATAPATTKTAAAAPAGKARTTVRQTATDFRFSQPKPTAKSGTVVMTLTNDGQAPHAIELHTDGGEVETETVSPGRSTRLEAKLPPGRYEFYCPVGNHEQLGMTGELTVK